MRERVYGLETEYAIIYQAAAGERRAPSPRMVYKTCCSLLRRRYKTIRDRGGNGLFLQNGARIHFEVGEGLQVGLLEVATPECRTARGAAIYQRALDQMVMELAAQVNKSLAVSGFRGTIHFGKNSTDNRGNFYGCQENYWVEDAPEIHRPLRRIASVAADLLVMLAKALILLLSVVPAVPLFFIQLFIEIAVRQLFRTRFAEAAERWILQHPLDDRIEPIFRVGLRLERAMAAPLLRLAAWLIEPVAFGRIQRDLMPFLVTRSIWCGSGRLCPDGSFELMQRREAMGLTVGIVGRAHSRPAITLKNLLMEKGTLHAARKRLQILYSDSNPSETVTWLKLGITGLLLEMIESGVDLKRWQLSAPLQALRTVSQDVTLAHRIPLRDGRELTALEIQRGYLDAARDFFADRDDAEIQELLQRWEQALDLLSVTQDELGSGLDWMAKRHLLEAAARPYTLLDLQPLHPLADLDALPTDDPRGWLSAHASPSRQRQVRLFVEYHEISWTDLPHVVARIQQMRKIDLKYHEMSPDGYAERLRSDGCTPRLVPDEMVADAMTTPPPTRARARGELIAAFCGRADVWVDWDEFRTWGAEGNQRVLLPDPLNDRTPSVPRRPGR